RRGPRRAVLEGSGRARRRAGGLLRAGRNRAAGSAEGAGRTGGCGPHARAGARRQPGAPARAPSGRVPRPGNGAGGRPPREPPPAPKGGSAPSARASAASSSAGLARHLCQKGDVEIIGDRGLTELCRWRRGAPVCSAAAPSSARIAREAFWVFATIIGTSTV